MRLRWLPLFAAPAMVLCTSCARMPANSPTGARLVVTVTMDGPINDQYQYFFLIRNGNQDPGTNGPIAVKEAGANNGFATGPNKDTAAFTDCVEYSANQIQASSDKYVLYHVLGGIAGDPNAGHFWARGEPSSATDPGGGKTLRFELPFSYLTPLAGEVDPNNGTTPRFLQVNFVATTIAHPNTTIEDPNKYVDAFGDQDHLGSGYITIDCAQIGALYQSSQLVESSSPYYEPVGDVWPSEGDHAVDIAQWSIRVTK